MSITEEELEEIIQKRINEMKILNEQATSREDLDFILRKFSLKCIKNKKKSSPMSLKKDVKKKIIQMAICEPNDIFDYDYWVLSSMSNTHK